MRTQKLKTELRGFFGIDRSSSFGPDACDQIQNFRIDPSGALVKRPGRKQLISLSTDISAAMPFTYEKDGKVTDLIYVAPPYFVARDSSSEYRRVLCSDAASDGERVGLCIFDGVPVLFDGYSARCFDRETLSLSSIEPYVPLYGKDWSPSSPGEVFEPINIMSDEVRISFSASEAASEIKLGFYPTSLLELKINGETVSDFSLDGDTVLVSIPENGKAEARFYVEGIVDPAIFACRSLSVLGEGDGERLICFDSKLDPSLIFCSALCSGEAEKSELYFGDRRFYFPDGLRRRLCGRDRAITAVCPCGDGFASFTEDCTFFSSFIDNEIRSVTLSTGIGCVSRYAACAKNRSVYTFSSGGIYRFDIDFSQPYDTTVEKLSAPLEGDPYFRIDESCAIYDNEIDGEIWFCCPSTVFIYNTKFKRFYSYASISAAVVFSLDGKLLLFEKRSVWRFSDELFCDLDTGDHEFLITANVKTRWIDFGDATLLKHGLEIEPLLSIDGGGRVMVGVETEGKFNRTKPIYCPESPRPFSLRLRFSRCRFKRLRFTVTSYDADRPSIFGATVTARAYK